MKKAVLLPFVLVLLSTGVAVGFITPVYPYLEKTESRIEVTFPVHNIYSGKDFSTIQEAINDNETLDGHTILVDAGTYHEHVVVNKSLTLIGENKETTIIDGNLNGTVMKVTVSNVLAKNFVIRNSGVGWYYYGIRVEASRCSIINNVIAKSLWGVDLDSSPNSTIFGNNITNNTAPGVRLNSSPNVTISGNNITNNIGTGVLVYNSVNVTISGNNVKDNSGDGIVLLDSANSVVSGNNVTNNGGGMEDGYGVILSSNEILMEKNIITRNYCGLAVLGGNNLLKNNTMSSNFKGICLEGNKFAPNQIYHNNFIENENQVALESSNHKLNVWDNGYPSGGNYWSNYASVDQYSGPYQNETGSDGVGDTPYTFSFPYRDNYPLTNPTDSPQPPIAILTYVSEHPVVDEAVTFDATSSHDRDGFIARYQWNFDDGNVTTTAGPYISHVYTASGIYILNLTVTDNAEFSHSIIKSLTIEKTSSNVKLTIDPTTGTIGSDLAINGTITPTKISANVTVSLRLFGAAWTTLATLETDLNSHFTYAWEPTEEGIYNIKASWQGDKNTLPAESEKKTVIVDSTPPTIGIPSRMPYDDILPDQPVEVTVHVTDILSGVKNVTLSYTINEAATWASLSMNYSLSTGLYEATIPPQKAGTWIRYKIIVYDEAENQAIKDGTEPYCTYQVIPEFPAWTLPFILLVSTVAIAFRKRVQ